MQLVRLKQNCRCADCRSTSQLFTRSLCPALAPCLMRLGADPAWGSTNLGIFLCLHCAGVHRSIGTHIRFAGMARLQSVRKCCCCWCMLCCYVLSFCCVALSAFSQRMPVFSTNGCACSRINILLFYLVSFPVSFPQQGQESESRQLGRGRRSGECTHMLSITCFASVVSPQRVPFVLLSLSLFSASIFAAFFHSFFRFAFLICLVSRVLFSAQSHK